MKYVTDTTYITYLNNFLDIIYLWYLFLYTYLSDFFNFLKIERVGWAGCSAQVEIVPIACASLVANATGPK